MYGISPKAATIVEIEGLYDFVSANNPPAKNRGAALVHQNFYPAFR
jgi:hypothetical protein